MRAAGVLQQVLDALPAGMRGAVYDGTPSNPTEAAVREAVALFQQHGCDGLVAVGGGSSIDCAKGVGDRRAPPRAAEDLRDHRRRRAAHHRRRACR